MKKKLSILIAALLVCVLVVTMLSGTILAQEDRAPLSWVSCYRIPVFCRQDATTRDPLGG